VLGLPQASVYLFHNGPNRKLFMDGRLEVANRETFVTYVRLEDMLNSGRQGWAEPLRRMGDPLILIDHRTGFGAEATLLTDPGWRCVYYDAIASVFVSRSRRDLVGPFPSVDFGARHFHDAKRQAAPPVLRGLFEAQALVDLALAVQSRARADWRLGVSPLLLAFDRLRQGIASDPTAAANWATLGTTCWDMVPEAMAPPHGPDEPWELASGLLPAQATFCLRRAIALDPGEIAAPALLSLMFEAQAMSDAKRTIDVRLFRGLASARLAGTPLAVAGDRRTVIWPGARSDTNKTNLAADVEDERLPAWQGPEGLDRTVTGLLTLGRPEAAVRLFEAAEDQHADPLWSTCDRVAAALLHLGRPLEARRVWVRAAAAPSPALRQARLATAALAALDFSAAEQGYRAALRLDADTGEAWVGLALLYTQRAEAASSLAAARAALGQPITPPQKALMLAIERFVEPYATSP
jgi:tetratricopeptide (TPR) repeat protein